MFRRKTIVSVSLAFLMAMVVTVPVLAIPGPFEISGDVSWGNNTENGDYTATGNCNITIPGGQTASVGQINGGGFDISFGGGGSLNAESSSGPAISGRSVSFDNVTVNATSNTNVIEAGMGGISIKDSTVTTTGTGQSAGALNSRSDVTISGSDVTASAQGGHAIFAMSGISIDDSNVSATSTEGGAIFTESGSITIDENLTITTPEGGYVATPPYGAGSAIYGKNGPTGNYDTGASEVVIEKGQKQDGQQAVPFFPEIPRGSSDDSVHEDTPASTQPIAGVPSNVVYATLDPASMGEAVYVEKVVQLIENTPFGGTVKIYGTEAIFIDNTIISALETRSDVSLEIHVKVGETEYVISIPAGYNLRSLLGTDGKIDIQKLIITFGRAV
ncbi:MAG: hypothetical protein K6E49_06855 [Lachnospiraceae bacterium]|nr:hypothetical protein [Lachnospiraceae bacterium]